LTTGNPETVEQVDNSSSDLSVNSEADDKQPRNRRKKWMPADWFIFNAKFLLRIEQWSWYETSASEIGFGLWCRFVEVFHVRLNDNLFSSNANGVERG